MRTKIGGLAAAAVGLAVLTGCGGGGGGDSTSAADITEGGSSVEDQLGFTRTGTLAATAQVENEVAACMKAQGFEYTPVDPVAADAALTGKPNVTSEEFEQQFAYGISTLYDKGTPQTDPNGAIVAGLSPADQQAYDLALSGGRPEQTFALAIDTGDFSLLGGCIKSATDQLFGGEELLTTLQRKLDDLDDSITQDQRMVAANQQWIACMQAETGSTYEDSEAVEAQILTEFQAIAGPSVGPGAVAEPGATYDTAALSALQARELELIKADLACEEEHINSVEETVQEEKEALFREQNADLLSQVKPLGS